MSKITAQVAAEYVINHPDEGWSLPTMEAILVEARATGVADHYVDSLADIVADRFSEVPE
jgi:hypothetical protein